MHTRVPPFHRATSDDPLFKLIVSQRFDLFWATIETVLNRELTEDFKSLIT